MFGVVLSAAYTVMLAYVLWRVVSVSRLARRLSIKGVLGGGVALWLAFLLGRFFGHNGTGSMARALEFVGMTLMGCVFLTSTVLFVVDLTTGFGRLLARWSPALRGWAILVGGVLSFLALVQGFRAPAVSTYEVDMAGLPAALDGTVLVALSDTHIGLQYRERVAGLFYGALKTAKWSVDRSLR